MNQNCVFSCLEFLKLLIKITPPVRKMYCGTNFSWKTFVLPSVPCYEVIRAFSSWLNEMPSIYLCLWVQSHVVFVLRVILTTQGVVFICNERLFFQNWPTLIWCYFVGQLCIVCIRVSTPPPPSSPPSLSQKHHPPLSCQVPH